MGIRYQVFVSSTYADLKNERQKVIQTLMEMDCIPSGMELFPAVDEEQWKFIKTIIDDCDYYLLIIGGRYGSTTKEGISYTEKEYEYAIEKGIRVIALIHSSPENLLSKNTEGDPVLRDRLEAFREKVMESRLVKYWEKADDLPGQVALSLSKTIKAYPAVGWVRADKVGESNKYIESEAIALKDKLETLSNDFSEVLNINHSIQDQLRDRLFELFSAYSELILDKKLVSSLELIDYERANELFYLFVVNNLKTAFDSLTKDRCSVCIKLLDEGRKNNGSIMVRTFIRDSASYSGRRSSDKSICEYPYYENTAFKSILSPDSPNSIYVSDDLLSEKTYINLNPNWNNYYNATLVCPIRISLIPEKEMAINEYSVVGFICIDNMKGRLDNEICTQLLSSVSDGLYNHFLLFNELKNEIAKSKQDKNIEKY